VIEKETFPIIEAAERLRNIPLKDEGFRLFTDLRNLIKRARRCASNLFAYKYVIEHIPGESNIWADILSIWKDIGDQKVKRPT